MHDFKPLTWILTVLIIVVCLIGIMSKLRFRKERQASEDGFDENGENIPEKEHWFFDRVGFLLLILVLIWAMCEIAQIIIWGGVL
jgi:Ca2+/Na+ antiporter